MERGPGQLLWLWAGQDGELKRWMSQSCRGGGEGVMPHIKGSGCQRNPATGINLVTAHAAVVTTHGSILAPLISRFHDLHMKNSLASQDDWKYRKNINNHHTQLMQRYRLILIPRDCRLRKPEFHDSQEAGIMLCIHVLVNVQLCFCKYLLFVFAQEPAKMVCPFEHQLFPYCPKYQKKKQLSLRLLRWKQSKLNRVMIIVAAIIILLWANQWTELAAAVSLCRMCWQRVVIHPQWTSKTGAQPNMMRRQKEKRLFHTRRRLGCEIISYRTQ